DGDAAPVGVYAGVMWGHYQLLFHHDDGTVGNPSAVASTYASVANRVSHVLDLHGPSMAVDTMCSSSLTAIDLACRDLRAGRTRMAFAGGVNLSVHPSKYRSLSDSRFISAAGRCESFGRGGDGYVPAEGVGVVVLKPFGDAVRDGDHVYGVIKGIALSHGGRTSGYTVPNPKAQADAIRLAVAESGVDPAHIGYVEAHGTGTALGDPIEVTALTAALGDRAAARVAIGSVKSNIGHGESAAGVAGLTKVLLQLRHGRIVPSLHSQTLNPNIDFEATPFEVNQRLRDWVPPVVAGDPAPRVAGLSSFGAGGANAHLVVAEHVEDEHVDATTDDRPLVVPLSARDEDRLAEYGQRLSAFVDTALAAAAGAPKLRLVDLAHTFQVGRERLPQRLAVVARTLDELADLLHRHLGGEQDVAGVYLGNAKRDRRTPSKEPAAATDNPHAAARAWVFGDLSSWGSSPRGARRISAPTYPFARHRHWPPDAPGPRGDAGPGRERRLLVERWRAGPPTTAEAVVGPVGVLHDDATRDLALALRNRVGA
ncbi:MAG: beta-ketoacyl synthase N-terminal-like domain-containing protein, partial [Phycicoccus sp.]